MGRGVPRRSPSLRAVLGPTRSRRASIGGSPSSGRREGTFGSCGRAAARIAWASASLNAPRCACPWLIGLSTALDHCQVGLSEHSRCDAFRDARHPGRQPVLRRPTYACELYDSRPHAPAPSSRREHGSLSERVVSDSPRAFLQKADGRVGMSRRDQLLGQRQSVSLIRLRMLRGIAVVLFTAKATSAALYD